MLLTRLRAVSRGTAAARGGSAGFPDKMARGERARGLENQNTHQEKVQDIQLEPNLILVSTKPHGTSGILNPNLANRHFDPSPFRWGSQ